MSSPKNTVLINAANLHQGGGVQVAASFVFELVSLITDDLRINIWVSDAVADSLRKLGVSVDDESNIEVHNLFGLKAVSSELNCKLHEFELVFTVFGPNYLKSRSYIDLVGFAQAWIIDKSAYSIYSPFRALKERFRFLAQRTFFKKSHYFVTELPHVREGLIREGIAVAENIFVAHNCVSSLYHDNELWQPINTEVNPNKFSIGFLGRDYPHKNTVILPAIKRLLFEEYFLDVDFYVTFDKSEWDAKPLLFRRSIANVGSLSITQCPSFYNAMDAIIFPSFLECFSATPLEALVMKKPLFASNRKFVKDVCGEYAFYFEPSDAETAASLIANYIKVRHGTDSYVLESGRLHALNFSNPRIRAERYLEIIRNLLVCDEKYT